MATLHVKRDQEEKYTLTRTQLELAKDKYALETERGSRGIFEEIRGWCHIPAATNEVILQGMKVALDRWNQEIQKHEKTIKELQEKAPELEHAGERGGEEAFLVTDARYQYEEAAAGLPVMKAHRDSLLVDLKYYLKYPDVNFKDRLLQTVQQSLDKFDENIRVKSQEVAELEHKVGQQQRAEEGKLSNPPRLETPDPSGDGKRLEEIENVQKEQGKDIGALKGNVQKIAENLKGNTERINRLETKPPTAKPATPPESSKSASNTHESPHQEAAKQESHNSVPIPAKDPHLPKQAPQSVSHVDHLNRQKPVTVLVEVDKGKEDVEQPKTLRIGSSKPEAAAKPVSTEGDKAEKKQESTHPPSAPSKEAHPAGNAAHHDVESQQPAESQPDSKGKAPLHGPQPEKSETGPAEHRTLPESSKQAGNVEQSHTVNPPIEPKTTSDTEPQPKPAGESVNSSETAHKPAKHSPSNGQQKSASTESQHKPASQPPIEHKEPTTPGHAETQPTASHGTDHKDAAAHTRLDEHAAKISNLDTDLKDVKDEQTKHAAKQTAEVKQLKEHHQQQQVKIEKIEMDQAETGGKFDNLKEDHDNRVKDMDVMKDKLTAEFNEQLHHFDDRLTNKEKDIKRISDDQETQKQKLGDLETKAIGWDNKFTTLETDFGHLKSQHTKHEDMFLKLPTLQTNNDHATQDLKQIKGTQDTTIQDVHSLKVGLGQTQTDLKHTYEGLNKVDAKAEKIHTGITDLQQRVTTLEAGKGGGPNWGLVIGGGIAAVMAVGGLVGGFLWWKKRKRQKTQGTGKACLRMLGMGQRGDDVARQIEIMHESGTAPLINEMAFYFTVASEWLVYL